MVVIITWIGYVIRSVICLQIKAKHDSIFGSKKGLHPDTGVISQHAPSTGPKPG